MNDIKTKENNTHIAYYGKVPIVKSLCPNCNRESFIIDGVLVCCGIENTSKPKFKKRASVSPQDRKMPSLYSQRKILSKQNNRCIYCGVRFGGLVARRSENITVLLEWDHFIPFSYSQNNSASNFLASCQICNQIKSSQVFDSIEDAKSYIMEQRKTKGYENNSVPTLRETNRKNKKDKEILLKCVSDKPQHLEGHSSQSKETSFDCQASGGVSRSKSNDNPKENSKSRNKIGRGLGADSDLPEQPQKIEEPYKPNLELVKWLKEYISGSVKVTKFVGRSIGKSRTVIDAYVNGKYFLPKERGGLGVRKSDVETKVETFKKSVETLKPNVPKKPEHQNIVVNSECENTFVFTGKDGAVLAEIKFENGKVVGFEFGKK